MSSCTTVRSYENYPAPTFPTVTSQEQFLNVVDRDEAERRFRAEIKLAPVGMEQVELQDALGRVLAEDVIARVNVPSFDRSNFDGFAVQASDTYGAREEQPTGLTLLAEAAATGVVPTAEVIRGTAMSIATGGVVPRGADAVVMVEHADSAGEELAVLKSVAPGFGIAFAGTDIAAGETVLRQGELLTSRETGTLAAIGTDRVPVWRRPRVAIVSTGDEIIPPGQPMEPAMVYDSNARILADAVTELGGAPLEMGIVRDDINQLRQIVAECLATADVVLLSGGTSKGAGDLSYRVVQELADPGIVAHGVALKPGKPICLAVSNGKPVVILPGFPTSAIFTFHEFVAPILRVFGGRPAEQRNVLTAEMALKVNSEIGRTEYLLVGLVDKTSATGDVGNDGAESPMPQLSAYPMGKGSGSVTAFSRADGFVTISRHDEMLIAGEKVAVQLLGRGLNVADLVVIGSHCVGLDFLLSQLQQRGFHTKLLVVGSTGGLMAAQRQECDIAGIHLLDSKTGQYNRPFLADGLRLVGGYGRRQGLLFRAGDERFKGQTVGQAVAAALADETCLMVNRNQGSGTRILIDQLLDGAQPRGYAVAARSHNAVAAAVTQGRADWGIAIESVARQSELGVLPLTDEQYDFVIPELRLNRPAVQAFLELLDDGDIRQQLADMGLLQSTDGSGTALPRPRVGGSRD